MSRCAVRRAGRKLVWCLVALLPWLGMGIARVTLLPKGVNTLGALFERPNDGSLGEASRAVGADKFVLAASLSFVR